jgi:hypothetical protein
MDENDKFDRELNQQIDLELRRTKTQNLSQDDLNNNMNSKQSLMLYNETKNEMFEVRDLFNI